MASYDSPPTYRPEKLKYSPPSPLPHQRCPKYLILKRWGLAVLLSILTCLPVSAQELFLLGGIMRNTDNSDSGKAWQLEYREGLGEHFAYSLTYMNEGHVQSHHRDGNAALLWTRLNLLDRRLSLAAGLGPYFYYDTIEAPGSNDHSNKHGWGTMASAAATWYTDDRWLFQLRANWIETFDNFDSISTLIGIGYQLEAPSRPGAAASPRPVADAPTDNELTLFAGTTIVNSYDSQKSAAVGVEYRRGISRYMDWTVGWLYEGDNRLVRRDGLTTQFWAVKAFFEDRFTLGVGGGAYIVIDQYHHLVENRDGRQALSGIMTLTGSYRFHPNWGLRTSWNRIVTNYDRDTDVILGGVGYRF